MGSDFIVLKTEYNKQFIRVIKISVRLHFMQLPVKVNYYFLIDMSDINCCKTFDFPRF